MGKSKKRQHQQTILCVDPRGVLRTILGRELQQAEARITWAADGGAALQAIQGINPDVIVSDLETADYSGADLALSVKGFGKKKIPVLLVFPESSVDAQEVVSRCEADAFIVGDPSPSAMGAIVRGLLREAALHHRVHYVEDRLRREQRRHEKEGEFEDSDGFLPINVFKRILLNEARRSSRYHIPLGVLLVGFDSFQPLKARYGEQALAPLFSDMSRMILRVIRDIDIPVRSAPDTALLMLPHTDTLGAKRLGDRITGQARLLRVEVAGERIKATVSVGVAGYDGRGQVSFADLMRRARSALDAVRARGGDGLEVQ